MKPLVFDLFCGLGGWSKPFLEEGYDAVGFDIEAHDYGNGGYPGQLVVCDIRTLSGKDMVERYGIPNVIVASPPCTEYSYMAMPFAHAKAKMRRITSSLEERRRLNDLFEQCFRLQREIRRATGLWVPLIVENVRGAQHWVGRAKYNCGSFYLWGDVPALLPDGRFFKSKDGAWFNDARKQGTKPLNPLSQCSSKSEKRRQLSAEIAQIPEPIGRWIARVFKR